MSTTDQYSIFTFDQMSAQDIFNMGLQHIRKTGKKGERTVPGADPKALVCSYEGSGCVASVFLREDKKGQADCVGSWSALVEQRLVPSYQLSLVSAMQHAHDDASNMDFMAQFESNMATVAKNFNLNYSAPEVPA